MSSTPSTPTGALALTSSRLKSPATPSGSFPYAFTPRLPKVGTAKLRLRSNLFGLCGFILVWWQHSIYASAKTASLWVLSGALGEESGIWIVSSIGQSSWPHDHADCLFRSPMIREHSALHPQYVYYSLRSTVLFIMLDRLEHRRGWLCDIQKSAPRTNSCSSTKEPRTPRQLANKPFLWV